MPDGESIQLLNRVRGQDAAAAEELFQRYLCRLLALVRTRMSGKLTRRLDPDDVVQSAFRSFFVGAKEGKFVLQRSGDLWRLLAAITLNKLAKQVERQGAAQRNVFAEQSTAGDDRTLRTVQPEMLAADPTPAQAAALVDEVEYLMRDLDDVQRQMVELRLSGYKIEEIAAKLSRSERTVRRLFDKLKVRLQQRLEECAAG